MAFGLDPTFGKGCFVVRNFSFRLVLPLHGIGLELGGLSLDGEVPEDDLDCFLPFGIAAVRRQGTDVTIICYFSLVPRLLRIADQLHADAGINAEVIDLSSLDYAHIDFDALGRSINKTG